MKSLKFIFFLTLFYLSCTENVENLNHNLKDTSLIVESRSTGLGADCKPNPCQLCNNIDIELDYTYNNCFPDMFLKVVNHGGGNCPGILSIDWGVGNGFQVYGNCFNMACANFYTTQNGKTGIHYSYDICSPKPCYELPSGTCSQYLVYFKYEYDSTCSTCFGGLAGNPDCNPLIICKKITVCNFIGSNPPCIAR